MSPMRNHEMRIFQTGPDCFGLVCECGYCEDLPDGMALIGIVCYAETHKADVLIRAMELLGVKSEQDAKG